MMKLSRRIESVRTSRTVRFSALIAQLRRQGREIINFAVGEPEYETPASIVSATGAALEAGETRYGPAPGIPELREALTREFPGTAPENILITNGSKHALYALFQCICDPGDEIIIPVPCWVSFFEQVRLAGGTPVPVRTKGHQLDLPAIASAVTSRTRAVLVNSPNNPTGAVYPSDDLARVAEIALHHDLWLISDEAYAEFVYGGKPHVSLFDFQEIRNHLFVTRSFSKSHAMTGFRVGFSAGPQSLISAMTRHQSHATGNVCTFAQHGALAALSPDRSDPAAWREDLAIKRDIAYEKVSAFSDCIRPEGAFYLFPNISRWLADDETAEDLCAYLLENAGVAVVPGEAFEAAGHVRISYAVPEETLTVGLDKIARALKNKGEK